jgi:hypothetical protein
MKSNKNQYLCSLKIEPERPKENVNINQSMTIVTEVTRVNTDSSALLDENVAKKYGSKYATKYEPHTPNKKAAESLISRRNYEDIT